MSYVDAIHDKERDIVHVVERVNGKREFKEIPAKYTFYYKEQRGRYTSIFILYSILRYYFSRNNIYG